MKTGALAAVLLLVPLMAQPTVADPGDDEWYAFTDSGTVAATVLYADGLATTRMGFFQITGSSGTTTDRLVPAAECTEWVGTFSQLLVEAGKDDAVQDSTLRLFGGTASPGAARAHDDVPFVLDVLGGAMAWKGSLLVCDDPNGAGLIRLNVDILPLPFAHNNPGVARVQFDEVTA